MLPVKQNISQVAFSCKDASNLRDWYHQIFNFPYAGATLFGGPQTSRVQGLPKVREKCLWLMDAQQHFQLEFFQFWSPTSKPKNDNWQLSDIGYNMLSIVVDDFDGVISSIAAHGQTLLAPVSGGQGSRQACVLDIEGNHIVICEQDFALDSPSIQRADIGVVVRRMTAVVPNLQRASKNWIETLGLSALDENQTPASAFASLMNEEDYTSLHLSSGNFLIELVEHKQAKSRPEAYRICDIGFMNVAIGLPSVEGFNRRFYKAVNDGYRPNGEPLDAGVFKVMYVNDEDDFSVEILYARPWAWFLTGFKISESYVENEIIIKASKEQVWQALTDHGRMGDWSLFKGVLSTPGVDDQNGVGAIRTLSLFGAKITEEITQFEPHKQYTYRLLTGAPFKKHKGIITVTDTEGGVSVRWSIRFETKIIGSGKLTAWILQKLFGRDLQALKHRLELGLQG